MDFQYRTQLLGEGGTSRAPGQASAPLQLRFPWKPQAALGTTSFFELRSASLRPPSSPAREEMLAVLELRIS